MTRAHVSILDDGTWERTKGACHAAAAGLALLMAAYNAAALIQRGEGRHLARNAALYLVAAAFEWRHTRGHWRHLC